MEQLNFSSDYKLTEDIDTKNHSESLDKINKHIKELKLINRDSYKKVSKCTSEKEQEIVNKNFGRIFELLNDIHKESFNLDDMMIWQSVLEATDNNKMDELEKKTYDEFLIGCQLGRGKQQNIKKFESQISNIDYIRDNEINSTNMLKDKRNISSKGNSLMDDEMDIDL